MSGSTFTVRLTNFEGPFDLLLQLITRRKLDVTEVSLSVVTDDFISHVREGRTGDDAWDLDQTTSFMVVAATLLDLKAARLLPQGEVEDPEDIAMLEARDLLFARLLQYRAFKEVAGLVERQLAVEGRRHARPGGLEAQFKALLPELEFNLTPDELAWLAMRALTPKEAPTVSLEHLHVSRVSVVEQAEIVVTILRETKTMTFRALVADANDRLVVVARFLVLLDLARQRAVAFEQLTALGELTIRWTGSDDGQVNVTDEFDHPDELLGGNDG